MCRNYFTCTRYVDGVPFFILWDSNEDATKNNFVIDDAYLTPLCLLIQRIPIWKNYERHPPLIEYHNSGDPVYGQKKNGTQKDAKGKTVG